MKALLSSLLISLLNNSAVLKAQYSLQGIYLSPHDFRNKQITFSPVQNKKYRIVLNDFFYKSTIRIITGDTSYTFYKDSIFGYRDKENIVHRFYEKNIYEIINPGEAILLYSLSTLGGYKNTQTITTYFFSTAPDNTILPLTKWNLKSAFPQNAVFHELLDMYFRNDNELIRYDHFYKIYKLNRTLQFSQQFIHENKIQPNEQK